MEEIPVIQIYLWGNLVGAMSWDNDRGYADFQFASDKCVADAFERADEKMYENKKKLKKK